MGHDSFTLAFLILKNEQVHLASSLRKEYRVLSAASSFRGYGIRFLCTISAPNVVPDLPVLAWRVIADLYK